MVAELSATLEGIWPEAWDMGSVKQMGNRGLKQN